MFLRVAVFFTLALGFILTSCAPEGSQTVLAKFGDQKITLGDFEKAYNNNVGNNDAVKKDSLSKLKNFLNLYVDFRMKLRDAEVRGFDSDSEMQNELLDYKKKVGVTYFLETHLVDPAIHQLYDRREWEYRVSHIMIRPDSTGDAAAKKLAEDLLDSLKNGADFATLAKKYSQDRYSASDGGDIFYITAGEVPPEFEDAVYATQPGHIYPHVVKTPFGYHIIEVTDKRLRIPEIRASHILASFYTKSKVPDTTAARLKIDSAMAELKAGVDFADVAKKFSDDFGSKQQGGDLGYFGIRMMVKPFAEAAFNLKKVGDISPIIETRYGFHIIKLTGIKPRPTFEEDKDNLTKIYKRTRYQAQYDSLIAELRKKFDYRINDVVYNEVAAQGDTGKINLDNPDIDKIKNDSLFYFNGGSVSVDEFFNKLDSQPGYSPKFLNTAGFKQAVDKVSGDVLLEQQALILDKTDPRFASLMKNYKDGIYIFKLQQDEVWNKLKVDSTDLYKYYLANKEKYKWPNRVEFKEIYSRSDSAINHYYDLLKQGESFDSLASKYTERSGYKAKAGDWGLVDVNSSDLAKDADKLEQPGDYSKPISFEGGFSIIYLVKKDPAHDKTFEEARAEVSGAYQEVESKKLENDYIDYLTKIYKPKIYYSELDKVHKSN